MAPQLLDRCSCGAIVAPATASSRNETFSSTGDDAHTSSNRSQQSCPIPTCSTSSSLLWCGRHHSSTTGSNAGRVRSVRPFPLGPATLLVIAMAAFFLEARGAEAYGTEISSSVALFRFVDLNAAEYINGNNASRCVHMVNRAGRTGSQRINFVISHYFVDQDKDFTVDYYCFKLSSSPDCTPATPELIAQWVSLFQPCLQYAVDLGFDIAFTPHLDDGLNNGQWRNAMLINPLARHGGLSYFDFVLKPLADVMAATIKDNTHVWFALQGEMSAMVTGFPREHTKLLPYIKQIIVGSHPERADHVRVGVSTNFNKLCGMEMCQTKDVKEKLDAAGVRELYKAVDFVGISAYPRYKGKLIEMEDSTQMFDQELKLFGIDLAKLINVDGKEFVFNEFGIGGGASVSGDQPARTVQQVADGPFFGVYGPYTRKLDPWRLFLPVNVLVGTRDFAHEWFDAAALWLSRKGGPTWRVDHVFMWNLNSWDVQGIHMESTTKEGSYKDEAIYKIIRSHNLKTRGLDGYDTPGSIPPY